MCAFKNYGGKTTECPMILCPCPVPRRLLTSSNWISRNDSSNVSAVLHPENYLVSPRLKYGEKTKGDVIEKHILSRNTCYCRCKNKKLTRPTFFKRPNTCVSYGKVSKYTSTYDDDLKRTSITGCICNELDEDDLDESEPLESRLLRLRQSKNVSVGEGLKFSDQRQLYGGYRETQEQKFKEEVQRYRESEQDVLSEKKSQKYPEYEENVRSLGENGGGDIDDLNTILGTQNYGTNTSTSKYDKYGATATVSGRGDAQSEYGSSGEFPGYSDEHTVTDFRKVHYFETHDIGKLAKVTGDSLQDHICVHQFNLDRRWLPEPVSQDSFGRSLCRICDRPMESSTLTSSSGYLFSEDNISRTKLKNYAEAYQNGLMPKSMPLSRKKSKIELVIKESDLAGFYSHVTKGKHPVFCNSLALRQQRMRLI